MTYNIPGVFTSVIDRSYVQPLIVEGRSVLIAGFSKYGEDKFYNFADADTMRFTLGDIDIKRYGLGLLYGLDSLTKTRNMIFKRLMPSDALYANLLFKSDGTTVTETQISDPAEVRAIIDADGAVLRPPIEPKELEVIATESTPGAGQSSVYFDYNPDNVTVYVNGLELFEGDFTAINGQEIIFNTPVPLDTIINIYTVIVNDPLADITFVKYQYTALNNTTIINLPDAPGQAAGYNTDNIWITLNGHELFASDFTATDGTSIEFHLGGVQGDGLVQDDVVRVHSNFDATGLGDDFKILEATVQTDGITSIQMPEEYNPEFTLLSIEGVVLGKNDYRADDGFYIYFSSPLVLGQRIRLHTVKPGDYAYHYGALIAKAAGEGYNDLYVQFRPATDVEKFYSDEEGDVRYKFNFLKAAVYEQTAQGQNRVSDEFVVSLIDEDPATLMPIISSVTGDSLFIDDKFMDSNEFIEFYLNKSFLPEFYKDLNIDALTVDGLGQEGANRLILKDQGANNRQKNIELVVNSAGEFEKKSTTIEGKPVIYTYYNDATNGTRKTVAIRIIDGLITINEEGTTGSPVYPMYLDGVLSFYSAYIRPNDNSDDKVFNPTSPYMIDKFAYTSYRQDFYNQLVGNQLDRSLWQMQSGSNGQNLIVDGRLNLGYIEGDHLYHEDAKQLMVDFYNTNEIIHEVLYPELDFDYVPEWTQDIDIANAIVQFADEIGFTMPIVSLPRQTDYEDDYLARIEDVYLSSFNTALYSGQNNDNHYLPQTGTRITCPSSYYAMLNHLNTDEQISITEPMANIVKGQLPVAGAKLSYIAKSPHIEKLRGVQVNTIIKEIDGIYFIDQLTAYKSASKLSRINVVKVIHRMRKDLPKILKDLLQRKALENVLFSAKTRTEQYMARWLVTDSNTTDGIFSEIDVTPLFVEEELKLIVSVAVKPIGTIEKIEVPITVY